MTHSVNSLGTLFEGGPFPHFQKSLALFRPFGRNLARRALFTILLGWVPLVLLVVAQELAGRPGLISSFFLDFGVQGRSLIAAPLFILSELACLSELGAIARHFIDAGLIEEPDRSRFDAVTASTKLLINSTTAEIIAIISAYAITATVIWYLPPTVLSSWYLGSDYLSPSWASRWHSFVSVPLLLILLFGWLWRVLLWSRFLFSVSRMKLRLIAAHPDRASGLRFLNAGLFGFAPVAFTLGVITAGPMANRVAHHGASLESIQKTLGGLLVFVLLLFVGPLLIFAFNLHREKIAGILRYGRISQKVGLLFEEKWLADNQEYSAEALEAQDFSATTDLYQIVSNVNEMTMVPFELKSLIALVVATLLPFVPVALMAIPLKVILKQVASLLF